MKLAPLLATVLAAILGSIAAHADSDFGLGQPRERGHGMHGLSDDDSSSVPENTLVIFMSPDGASTGVASPIARVVRFKRYLFLHDTFGNVTMVPYLTPSGAATDFQRIANGASVDVSGCLDIDRGVPETIVEANAGYQTCDRHYFAYSAQCSAATLVPLLYISQNNTPVSRFELRDIVKDPLTSFYQRCHYNY